MTPLRYGIASLVVWALCSLLLLRRYRGIFDLDPEDQKLMYYSEAAFYLSFYYDVVEADSLYDVWKTLKNDDRTEFPEVVVAFKRLNIAQEIVLGLAYRVLNLRSYIKNPFTFYATTVILGHAAGVAVLFFLACNCGGSILAGTLFLGLYISNYRAKLICRMSALPLRENFALPVLWISILCLQRLLNQKEETKKGHVTLFASYVWMILTWQLSLHIIFTQVCCLFFMHLLSMVSSEVLGDVTKIALGATAFSWAMMMFPPFVILSPLTTGCVAILISNLHVTGDSAHVDVRFMAEKSLLAVATFLAENMIVRLEFSHDSHIVEMLLSKLALAKPTFDSQIYMLGSEFQVVSTNVLNMIMETRLLQYAVLGLATLGYVYYKGEHKNEEHKLFNTYILLQTGVFIIMATLISRLRILALPLLCLVSSYSVLALRLPMMKRRGMIILVIAVVIMPYLQTMPSSEIRKPPFGELYNTKSLKDLIKWVNNNIEPGTPILADMPTSTALRISTKAKIVINPQFEYTPLRRKTYFFYTLGSCNSAKWFGETMRETYQTELVVVPMKFCNIPKRDAKPNGINSVLTLNPLGSCPPDTPNYKRMCNRFLAGSVHFERLFCNENYLVVRYRDVDMVEEDLKWESMNRLDRYKPWVESHAKADQVTGPEQVTSTATALKNLNLDIAVPLMRHGLEVFPGNERMIRLYAESLDYDFSLFEEAYTHYKEAFTMMASRCSSVDDMIFYLSFLSHMVETGNGNNTDILRVISASKKCLTIRYPRTKATELCEYAVNIMKAIKKRLGENSTKAKEAAHEFFQLSQAINHQNECFFRNYKRFYSKELATWNVLFMFLTYN